jgi:hypothetical protein
MIRGKITDGQGSGRDAFVTENNALKVQIVPETSKGLPPEDLANLRLLRVFLESSGSSAMNVDGSAGAFEFQAASEPGLTKWITGLRLILEGTNLEITTNDFRRFGAATTAGSPLTNGVIVRAEQSGEIVPICAAPIQRIGEFLSYTDDFLNLINSVSSQSDFLSFDFVFDKPVVLAEGGNDRVVIVIQDDLTAIDRFEAIARGYQEFV